MRGSLAGPRRPGPRRGRGTSRFGVERLEERQLLSTFTVTNSGDQNPDGSVVPGSFRDAILKANNNSGLDTIDFAIGSGQATIVPSIPLPALTDPVTIDGTSQPGYAGQPIVELDGESAGGTGLVVNATGSTIKGLVINRFDAGGIVINAGNTAVLNNFIGTDVGGQSALGNGVAGIIIRNASRNQIGGTGLSDGNVISGNLGATAGSVGDGIQVLGIGSANNQILGNKIGTGPLGLTAVPNTGAGIVLNGATLTAIGGNQSGAGNLISGNNGGGISLQATTKDSIFGNLIGTAAGGNTPLANGGDGIFGTQATTIAIGSASPGAGNVISANSGAGINLGTGSVATILGNDIGVGQDGTTDLGNGGAGVALDGADGTIVGGTGAGEANVIAFNGKAQAAAGVQVVTGAKVPIRGNSIRGNSRLGIDLGGDGVTANDDGDDDSGPNNLQNFPVLTNVATGAGRTLIQGTLNSTPSTTFTLDFYANDRADASRFGQGQIYLPPQQPVVVTTDDSGNATFSVTLNSPVLVGQAVTATATDGDGNTSEFAQDVGATQAQLANLGVSVTADPSPATLGSNYTYTIVISNAGPADATGVVVTDTLPDGVAFMSATVPDGVQTSRNGNVFTATFVDNGGNPIPIPAGQSATIAITVTPSMEGTFTNTVSVSSNQIDVDTTNNTVVTATQVVIPADLSVTVTSDPADQVAVGSRLVYTAIVTNKGPGQATGVVLTDTLPTDAQGNPLVTFVSAAPGQGTVNQVNGVVTANLGTLASGVSVAVQIIVDVGGIPGTLDNQVAVSADQTDPAPGDNTAGVSVDAAPSADLGISAQTLVDGSPATAALVGQPLTYELTIVNNGPSTATGIAINDMLPGTDIITLMGTPTITTPPGSTGTIVGADENLVSATIDQLAAGQTATLTIVVIPSHSGQITNTASVSGASSEVDLDATNNTASTTTPVSPADLAVSILPTPNPALAGRNLTYDVIVANLGPATASNVVLTDNLPQGVQVQSVSSDQGTAIVSNGVVTASLGTLASGASTTVRIVVVPQGSGAITDTANVHSDQFDTNAANDTAASTVRVSPIDLAVGLVAAPNPVAVGDRLTYTIVVVNKGPTTATNVALKDQIPAGVSVLSATGGAGVSSVAGPVNGVITALIPSLAAGASATVTIVVSPTASGTLSTTASAIADQVDTDLNNNSAVAKTTAFNRPGALQFSAPVFQVNEGSGTATITLTRTGGNLGSVSVLYAALPGTATPGLDFTPTADALTFADGETTKSFTVPIVDNALTQPDRTVQLLLGFPGGGATLGAQSQATLVIHDNDPDLFGPTVTNMTLVGGLSATNVLLTFSEPLDPFRAFNPANYSIVATNLPLPGGGVADVPIPIARVFYNAGNNSVAITPVQPLPSGIAFRVGVDGTTAGAITDLSGNPLAGDGTGVNGRNFGGSFIQGTNITYGDHNGDAVNLRLTGGGFLSLIRAANGDALTLRLVNTRPGRSTLSGSVRRAAAGADGVTTIGLIDGLRPFGRVRSLLTTPPFSVTAELPGVGASAVDGALASGGLTNHVRNRRNHR